MSDKYEAVVIRRDGGGQTNDDWHATVTRQSDGIELIWISRWRWVLNLQLNPKRVDKAFRRYDERRKVLDKREEFKL